MKICVIGTGYVGLVSGACLAQIGHIVTCVDVDDVKIQKLKEGIIPIYEPELEKVVTDNFRIKRLLFTTQLQEGIADADVILNAVGTPPDEQRKVDLRYVYTVAEQVGKLLTRYAVFVNKSTVPVGTAQAVKQIISQNVREGIEFDVASNPEFLREGAAVDDFLYPDRIIVGVETKKAGEILKKMYQPLVDSGATCMVTNIASAELIKYASNSFLATKISFINEIAGLCERVGADANEVSRGMGLDSRIGIKFLEPGPGYGGSCFPKDVDGLVHTGLDAGLQLRILEAVVDVNREQQLLAVQKAQALLGTLVGKTLAIWGLAFKPDTDDIRESSSLVVIKSLIQKGAAVRCYDPAAMENARSILKDDNVVFCEDKMVALESADCLILMTHWDEFKNVDSKEIANKLSGKYVVDMRNIWDRSQFEANNLQYLSVGKL